MTYLLIIIIIKIEIKSNNIIKLKKLKPIILKYFLYTHQFLCYV